MIRWDWMQPTGTITQAVETLGMAQPMGIGVASVGVVEHIHVVDTLMVLHPQQTVLMPVIWLMTNVMKTQVVRQIRAP